MAIKIVNKCSIKGCKRKYYGRNFCQLHWGRWYNTGDPLQGTRKQYLEKIKAQPVTCDVVCKGVRCNIKIGRGHGDGINHKGSKARKYCHTHEARWLTRGDVRADDPIVIQFPKGTERPPCIAPDCEKTANGWQGLAVYCEDHNQRVQKHGRLHLINQHNIGLTCSAKGCDKVSKSGADRYIKGMCSACYLRVTGKGSANASRRRARKANTKCDNHTIPELQKHWRAKGIDPKRCTYCDAWYRQWKNNWKSSQGDHVVPLDKGGTNLMYNLVPCCLSCNSSKGAKILYEEWIPPKERIAA